MRRTMTPAGPAFPSARPLQRVLAALCLAAALSSGSAAVAQEGDLPPAAVAKDQIEHLLGYIATSPCTFIRNDTEYDAKAALKHVQDKYDYYKSDIHSAEDFIRLAASKSLMSGRPYQVRCPGAKAEPAAEWLQQELDAYRRAGAQPPKQ